MKKTAIYLLPLLMLFACRKDDLDTFDGPDLNDLYGPFYIVEELTKSQNQIDFTADGDLIFTAELSKNTDWVINITGAQTGAERTINGFERIINIDIFDLRRRCNGLRLGTHIQLPYWQNSRIEFYLQ